MGIHGVLRWANPPLQGPSGLDLIQQRVQEQFGGNISRKPFQAVIRTHRPHVSSDTPTANSNPTANADQMNGRVPGQPKAGPSKLLTTVQYPRATAKEVSQAAFVILEDRSNVSASSSHAHPSGAGSQVIASRHHDQNANGPQSGFSAPQGGPFDRASGAVSSTWQADTYEAGMSEVLEQMGTEKSAFLQPKKVAKEGEFKNVANMTASALGPSGPKRAVSQSSTSSKQPELTPGTTLTLDGVSFEIALGGSGVGSGVEWIVRCAWVGSPTAGNSKGLIVEAEYVPLTTLTVPLASESRPDPQASSSGMTTMPGLPPPGGMVPNGPPPIPMPIPMGIPGRSGPPGLGHPLSSPVLQPPPGFLPPMMLMPPNGVAAPPPPPHGVHGPPGIFPGPHPLPPPPNMAQGLAPPPPNPGPFPSPGPGPGLSSGLQPPPVGPSGMGLGPMMPPPPMPPGMKMNLPGPVPGSMIDEFLYSLLPTHPIHPAPLTRVYSVPLHDWAALAERYGATVDVHRSDEGDESEKGAEGDGRGESGKKEDAEGEGEGEGKKSEDSTMIEVPGWIGLERWRRSAYTWVRCLREENII